MILLRARLSALPALLAVPAFAGSAEDARSLFAADEFADTDAGMFSGVKASMVEADARKRLSV